MKMFSWQNLTNFILLCRYGFVTFNDQESPEHLIEKVGSKKKFERRVLRIITATIL